MPLPPAATDMPPEVAIALAAWNLAGGFDWSALDMLVELYGYDDPAELMAQFEAIRAWQQANRGA